MGELLGGLVKIVRELLSQYSNNTGRLLLVLLLLGTHCKRIIVRTSIRRNDNVRRFQRVGVCVI